MTREQPVPPTHQAQAESRIRNLALFWSSVGAGLGARRA